MLPFAGDDIQAAEVRLKYPSSLATRVLQRTNQDSPFNFDTNKGVEYGSNKDQGSNTVRGFDLGYSPDDVGEIASHAIYIGQPRPASGTVFIGAYNNSSARTWLFDWTDGYITGSWRNADYPAKQGQAPGFWMINRQQQDSTRLYYNGTYIVEEISSTLNSVPVNIHVGHNWGESNLYATETAMGFALIADPMTDNEADQTGTQVLQLMNSLGRSSPLDDGLVGWWRMDSSASVQRNGYNDVTVNTLPNKQGSAGDMQVATTAPEYIPRLKDERDMFASDAEGQALQVGSLAPGDEFTIIIFCATKANSTTIVDTPDWRMQWGWSGGVNLYDKPADTYGANASAYSTRYNVIALRVRASEHDYFFNGNFGTAESNTANLAGFSQMWLGNNSQTDTKGSIYGECLLYNRSLTNEELMDEYNRMEPFWGGLDEST